MNATCATWCGGRWSGVPLDERARLNYTFLYSWNEQAKPIYWCTPACRDAGRALNPPSLEAGTPPPKCECDQHQTENPCASTADYLITRAGKRLAVCDRCTLTGDGLDDRDLSPDWSKWRAGTPTGRAAGIEWPPPSLEERPDSATGRAASMCETCGGADVMEATREERNGLRASISVLEAHLARAQAERDAALKRTEGWRAEFEHARTDLAAALKREGEARRELEAVEGQRDAAIAGADVIARAAREARERAIEECAKVVEEFADETDSDPERLAVLSAALAVRALAPVPTAPPTHPNDCVCPFPRMLCPACHNPCRACRYARVPTAEDDKETTT